MKAMFIGAPTLNLNGKVGGKNVTVTAVLEEVIEISDKQKALIEASGTHVLVQPPSHMREEWDAEELSIRRSKVQGLVPMVRSDNWILTPIPEDPPSVPAEQVARAKQANADRKVAFAAELEAKRAKDAAKPKPEIKGAMHTTTEAEALAAEKAKEDKKR